MDLGEEEEDDDDDEKKKKKLNSMGGLKERMGKENPSGRYVLHYMYLPTYLT